METPIILKNFRIYLPDGDRRSFYIYGDFRQLFGVKRQADAAKKIKNVINDLNCKPKPSTNYSEVSLGISTRNPDILFKLILQIENLTVLPEDFKLSKKELSKLYSDILSWEAPKRQRWKVGDIFSIKLIDNSYAFGQIVGPNPTAALFNYKNETTEIILSDLEDKEIVTILHFTRNELNNWEWRVIGNYKLLADKDSGPTGTDEYKVGQNVYGSNALSSIANHHWFKINKWADENDIKKLIMLK